MVAFRLTMVPYQKPPHAQDGNGSVQNPTGWDESIKRMRASAEKRRAELTRDDDEHAQRELAYLRSRELSAQGHIPLRFHSDKRLAYYKDKKSRGPVKPRLYIDEVIEDQNSELSPTRW